MDSNKWFSVGENNIIDEEDEPYCKYCYANFKEYRDMVSGICQSCGRPSEFITKEKQSKLQLSSLNEPLNPEDMRGMSVDFIYTQLEQQDETTKGTASTATHFKAKSLKEAMNKLWELDTQNNINFKPYTKIIRGYDYRNVKLDEKITE
jgi:hypothetical protein